MTGSKIKLSTLGTVPIATNATNAVNATNATTAGAAPIAKVTYQANTVTIPAGTVGATLVIATCPAGTSVTGGGASVSNEIDGFVNDSFPNGKTAWSADVFNNSSTDTITATATAICAPAAATAP